MGRQLYKQLVDMFSDPFIRIIEGQLYIFNQKEINTIFSYNIIYLIKMGIKDSVDLKLNTLRLKISKIYLYLSIIIELTFRHV